MASAKTDNDVIVEYLMGKLDKISVPLQKKLERMTDCDRLIKLYPRRSDVLNMLVSKYKLIYGEEEYSMRTAIRDYQSTQIVWGATVKHDRAYHIDILFAEIAETREVAKRLGNPTAMAACDKTKMIAIKDFLGDKDTPDYSAIQVPDQIFSADLALLGMEKIPDEAQFMRELEKLRQMPKKGAKGLLAEDIAFEEVKGE
jgi:hypothetical protein